MVNLLNLRFNDVGEQEDTIAWVETERVEDASDVTGRESSDRHLEIRREEILAPNPDTSTSKLARTGRSRAIGSTINILRSGAGSHFAGGALSHFAYQLAMATSLLTTERHQKPTTASPDAEPTVLVCPGQKYLPPAWVKISRPVLLGAGLVAPRKKVAACEDVASGDRGLNHKTTKSWAAALIWTRKVFDLLVCPGFFKPTTAIPTRLLHHGDVTSS